MKSLSNQKLKSVFSIIFLFFTIFFLDTKSFATEKIKNFEVSVQINRNGTLTVNEVISYEFGDELRHGIYRDIPLRSKKSGLDINKSYVKMNWIKRDGEDEEYTKSNFFEGVRYRIGSETEFANTDKSESKYELNYTIYNAVFKKDDIYQIYYNAIGQFWSVPIEGATVTIEFPDGQKIEKNEIQKLEAYTGSYGEKGTDYDILENDGQIQIRTGKLPENNGLTFLLNLKTDKINPTFVDKLKIIYLANLAAVIFSVLLLFLTIYAIMTWKYFGKDPAGKSIIPEFNPPEDISPMFAAYIDGTRDPKQVLNAGIFSLLSKGCIVASKGENVKYSKNTDPIYSQNVELSEDERMLMDALSSKKNDIFADDKKLYQAGEDIIRSLDSKYHKLIYKSNNGFLVPFFLSIPVFLIFIFSDLDSDIFNPIVIIYTFFVLGSFFYKLRIKVDKKVVTGAIAVILVLLSLIKGIEIFALVSCFAVLFLIYAVLIGKYTNDGIRKKEYLKGMKMYIKTAEENQIKKFDSINELIGYFRLLLPFAVALGVKNAAINLMRKTIKLQNFSENETYINRHTGANFYYTNNFTNTFSRRYNKGQQKIFDEKFSSSKGGSGHFGGGGFSGGGFSGGGSGGGGGGSW